MIRYRSTCHNSSERRRLLITVSLAMKVVARAGHIEKGRCNERARRSFNRRTRSSQTWPQHIIRARPILFHSPPPSVCHARVDAVVWVGGLKSNSFLTQQVTSLRIQQDCSLLCRERVAGNGRSERCSVLRRLSPAESGQTVFSDQIRRIHRWRESVRSIGRFARVRQDSAHRT